MATNNPLSKGVTASISDAPPTPAELALNDLLIDELRREKNYEAAEETERRKKALTTLQKVTIQFVKECLSRKSKLPQSVLDAAGGKIFTYGSYRLGVYGPGSDIDTLVVAPKDVTRDDFFKYFPEVLERMSPPGAIEEMVPVPDAFVPIIKLEYSGISVDLIFASLAVSQVPLNLDLKDNAVLRGQDEVGLRCLNGTRVTDMILELVPQPKVFQTALRAVKLWAQRRGIYANIYGFPGGVAWAMLVARICQLYPVATGSVVVTKFFRLIGTWSWPMPVILKDIEMGSLKVWNPKLYRGDSFHLMPIITPAYPSMCSTHNVTLSTREIVTTELLRAHEIAEQITSGRAGWGALFKKHSFFTTEYRYYLCIVACSRTKEAQQIWSGLVESKVRHLVSDLEKDEVILLAHPYNKGVERVHNCKSETEIEAVMKGDLSYRAQDVKAETTDQTNNILHNAVAEAGATETANVVRPGVEAEVQSSAPKLEVEGATTNGDSVAKANPEAENTNTSTPAQVDDKPVKTDEPKPTEIRTTTYYIGLKLSDVAKHKLDISWAANKFKELCTSWPSYNADLNSVTVSCVRNHELPDDLFEEGEVKPTKPKKKSKRDHNNEDGGEGKKRKGTEHLSAPNPKRTASDTTTAQAQINGPKVAAFG